MRENGIFNRQQAYNEPQQHKPDVLDLFRNHPVTTSLISINIVVFLAMCISGVSIFEPTVINIINWGGNMRTYTLNGQWWRLITNIFEHIGLIHIALNMVALFQLGVLLERLVGWRAYLAVYLSSGVLASLVSLWWNGERVSAGASGAIFGLFGFFLALLLTNLIEKTIRMSLLKSVGFVIVLNLGFGMKGNIDNSAHIGGLISGIVFGFLIYLFIIKHQSLKVYSVIIAAIAIVIPVAYLLSHHDDTLKFDSALETMQVNEKQAVDAQNKLDVKNAKESVQEINTVIWPLWENAKSIIDKTNGLKLSVKQNKFIHSLQYYIGLRMAHISIIKSALAGDSTTNVQSLPIIKNGIDSILKELNAQ